MQILARIVTEDDVALGHLVAEGIEDALRALAGIVVGVHAPLDDGHGHPGLHPAGVGAARRAEQRRFFAHQRQRPFGAEGQLPEAALVRFEGPAAPVVEGMGAEDVILVVLLLQDVAVALQLLAHGEVGAARADFAQRVQRVGGGIVLGPVVEGDGHHLPPAVVGGGQARVRQSDLAGDDIPGGVVQRQLHAAQGEIRRRESLGRAQAVDGRAVVVLAGEDVRQVRPHALGQRLPGPVLKQVGQGHAAARLQIPGAGGEGRGKLLLLVAHARDGERAQVLFARAVVDGADVQHAAAPAPLARVGLQGGAELAVVGVHDGAQLGVHVRVGGGQVFLVDVGAPLVDLSCVLLHGDGEDGRHGVVFFGLGGRGAGKAYKRQKQGQHALHALQPPYRSKRRAGPFSGSMPFAYPVFYNDARINASGPHVLSIP